MNIKQITAFAGLSLLTVFMFQNCGQGFEALKVNSDSLEKMDVTILSEQPRYSSEANPEFEFSASVIASGEVLCRIDRMTEWAPCTSPYRVDVELADGNYEFQVEVRDRNGVTVASMSSSWTQDTLEPTIVIGSRPLPITSSRTAMVSFASEDLLSGPAEVQCSYQDAQFQPCTSPFSVANLADGDYSLIVRALDNARNFSEARIAWTVSTAVPLVMINSGPSPFSNVVSPNLTFSGSPGASFTCRLNQSSFAPCTSPMTLANLPDGPHRFEVRTTSLSGVQSDIVAASWVNDTVRPTVSVSVAPSINTNSRSAMFQFAAADNVSVARVECRLDADAFAPCSLQRNYSNLADGVHSFQLRSIDSAGNFSTVTTHTWTIGTVAPVVVFTSISPLRESPVTYADISFSGALTYQCSLDGAAFLPCVSPVSYTNLAGGVHTFRVRGTDRFGNVSAIAERSWNIDLIPPVITMVSGPSGIVYSTSVTVTFGGADGGYACALAPATTYTLCRNTETFTGLAPGRHYLYVFGRDQAGNASSPITIEWTVRLR